MASPFPCKNEMVYRAANSNVWRLLQWHQNQNNSLVFIIIFINCRLATRQHAGITFTHAPWLPVLSNTEPYEKRLPQTSWWRKLSNMTVGQSSLISLAHHCYD